MKLHITPTIGLIDEKIAIQVAELPPGGKLKVTASMHFPWAASEKYESFAWFIADSNGHVDLSKQKPDSGTYDYIDSMGLIASLRKTSSGGANIARHISIDRSVMIDMVCECEQDRECVRLERLFLLPEVKRQQVADEFRGELFYTDNTNRNTIILLGGSDGERSALSLLAGPLASRGFHVLTVGYFNEEGLPAKLEEVPLEYFEKVFAWLKNNPLTRNGEIYVHGTSKGGELALLLASRYNVISKVAVSAPHAYCFQALDGLASGNLVSSWSYKGVSLPFIPVDNDIFYEHHRICLEQNKPFGFASTYKTSVERAANKEDARIKIENAHADLLFIAGCKDNVWNTYDACVELMDILEKHNYKYNYKLLAYEDLGHSLPIPYTIPLNETLNVKMGEGVFTCGGTLEGNCYGQSDSWRKTIEFFMN
ncbi:acyl-CoA thioesterase/bile acid-CoA:amino acid N-acyltransferase family protein [Paenibacillus sp. MSJ-34]|uniref:acyl-CoA thioesterase/bile acid-CoA:amino acid N-acyltransferase family protein n=1 Tax=Paenibacillus sp. MSJ-34 TaxID=2841529 RepID=UPI001C1279D1|nr:acyl-CoA thioesterase/bile acid-CoA:amino acid N-acyltransferase family protein [Paenibacillus sp. MSJ-34]MBU5442928.1 acyl-CoA thioesterase/BAAT N-terminal domain-containing protein [Paenibacillus sp. MSJ-34]